MVGVTHKMRTKTNVELWAGNRRMAQNVIQYWHYRNLHNNIIISLSITERLWNFLKATKQEGGGGQV